MFGLRLGALRIFRFSGIDVYLHWSWFFVAVYELGDRGNRYSSLPWYILEYLALFLIVTLHEFGHALACRQVGGVANRIVLWPLGGVAYVNPPPRPGANLWCIAAGPLVNVALVPVFMILGIVTRYLGWATSMPNFHEFLHAVAIINFGLLIFNLLPIYPLDGGQIFRSLLWFLIGRAHSLMVATIFGFLGVAGLIALAVWTKATWFVVLSIFVLLNCWKGLQHARSLLRLAKAPRHEGFACPSCKAAPPAGTYWVCRQCTNLFDTFKSDAVCPSCSTQHPETACLNCGNRNPMSQWAVAT